MKAQVKKIPYYICGPFSKEAEKLILDTLSKNEFRPEPKHSRIIRSDLIDVEAKRCAAMKIPYDVWERYFEWRFHYPINSLHISSKKIIWYGKRTKFLTIKLSCS